MKIHKVVILSEENIKVFVEHDTVYGAYTVSAENPVPLEEMEAILAKAKQILNG